MWHCSVTAKKPLQTLQSRTLRLGDLREGNIFQDRRQPGHQDAGASQPNPHRLSTTSQSIPEGEPLDDSPLPINPVRDIVITESDKQLLADLRKAPRCIISRYATAWAELSGLVSVVAGPGPPFGSDRNAELKQRLRLWEA